MNQLKPANPMNQLNPTPPMKIAICFCGSIRDFPTCFPSMKRFLLNNLQPDIFLHLWKMSDVSSMDAMDFKWRNDSCQESYVLDKLKPVSHIISEYTTEWQDRIIKESGIDISKLNNEKLKNYGINACGMYYKIRECFKLVEDHSLKTGTKYDLVIRARLDFIWEDHVLLSDFSNLNDQTVYLVRDRYATLSRLVTNDKFFAGSFGVMKKMCDIFTCIKYYQQRGLMVEGQVLNENHIKGLKLKVGWIGHLHTYYKCMVRHRLTPNHKTIGIRGQSRFLYELAYTLLYEGYDVVYLEKADPWFDILTSFPNFKCDESFDPGCCYLYITQSGNEIQISKGVPNIASIKSNDNEIQISKGPPTITSIKSNDKICLEELLDFVISIISTNKFGQSYVFTKAQLVLDIDPNENVIYKYLDHGYYQSKVTATNSKVTATNGSSYTITFGKESMISDRASFKIVDLMKYHQRMDPSTMPSNLQRHRTLQ